MTFTRTVLVLAVSVVLSLYSGPASADELTDDFSSSPATSGNWCEKDLSVRWQAAGYMAGLNADCCGIPSGGTEEVGGSTDCGNPCDTLFSGEANFCAACDVVSNARGCQHLAVSQDEFVGDERSVSIAFGFGNHLSPFPDNGCTAPGDAPEHVKVVSAAHGACDARIEARIVRIGDPNTYMLSIRLFASAMAGYPECSALDQTSGAQLFTADTSTTPAYELNLLTTRSSTNPSSELSAVAEVVEIATGTVKATVSWDDFVRPAWYDRPGEGRRFAFGGSRDALSGGTVFDDFMGTASPVPLDPGDPLAPNGAPAVVEQGVATDVRGANEFLYAPTSPGEPTIQTAFDDPDGYINPADIKLHRAALLRGAVSDRGGAELSGVRVSILDHPELGQTHTRMDGLFDLVVNGGGLLTVVYEKAGFITAHRRVDVPWQDGIELEDVILLQRDPSIPVALGSPTPQMIQGLTVSADRSMDLDRAAALFFPANTTISNLAISGTIGVSATEVTFASGPDGRKAMPAELPPRTAYTYAVELSVDEALDQRVDFDQHVILYVENFLNFEDEITGALAGIDVPLGYYDRTAGVWKANEDLVDGVGDPIPFTGNGRIIYIDSEVGGFAQLDTTGDGQVDNGVALPVPVTADEQAQLAALYDPGESLWRMPIKHFTTWDANWPFGPPPGAGGPGGGPPGGGGPDPLGGGGGPGGPGDPDGGDGDGGPPDPGCEDSGSIVECQDQAVGQRIGIVGTPYSLNYRSDRMVGTARDRVLEIDVHTDPMPPLVKRIDVEVLVAGKRFDLGPFAATHTSPVVFNQWDGTDAYGRMLQGAQPTIVRVGYVYDGVYQQVGRFGYDGNGIPITGNVTREEVTLWQEHRLTMTALDGRGFGLGGWTLDVHHSYDPYARVLYLGDGANESAENVRKVAVRAAGNGAVGTPVDGAPAVLQPLPNPMFGAAAGPDGSVYFTAGSIVYRIDRQGRIYNHSSFFQFGGYLSAGPDGSVYISHDNRVHRILPNGTHSVVAGNGSLCQSIATPGGPPVCGDEGLAVDAEIGPLNDTAVGPDGSLYIVGAARLRRVGPDGTITTIAGTGTQVDDGDGGPALAATLKSPRSIAVDSEGTIYITTANRVRGIGTDGTIRTIAGTGISCSAPDYPCGDGGSALFAQMNAHHVAVAPDGAIYVTDINNAVVRRVRPDGLIVTVLGELGNAGLAGEDGPAVTSHLNQPQELAVGPSGELVVADVGNRRIVRVGPPFDGLPADDTTPILIPSRDGSLLYDFDSTGRHVRTLDAVVGTELLRFAYDGEGLLASIVDQYDRQLMVGRPAADEVTLTARNGQVTTLRLTTDGERYLKEVENPAGELHRFEYSSAAGGLLSRFEDPRTNASEYTYDADGSGRLVSVMRRDGETSSLARTELASGFEVEKTSPSGLVDKFTIELLPDGTRRQSRQEKDGSTVQLDRFPDLGSTVVSSEGLDAARVEGPDPRFGMRSKIITAASTTIPATPSTPEVVAGFAASQAVTLADPLDPLSLSGATSLVDTVTWNGTRSFTSTVDSSGTLTAVALEEPTGRQEVRRFDSNSRRVEREVPGFETLRHEYDPATGLLLRLVRGAGAEEREVVYAYDTLDRVQSLTNPAGRVLEFEYDGANRVTEIEIDQSVATGFEYDANGNTTAIVQPLGQRHEFEYDAMDRQKKYTPPAVSLAHPESDFAYDEDGRLETITLPSATTVREQVSFEYISGTGQLDRTLLPSGQGIVDRDYDVGTGQLTTASGPGAVQVALSYAGVMPIGASWTGDVTGSVDWEFDDDLEIVRQRVNGANEVLFQYGDDGLLTDVGDLEIVRDSATGLVERTAIDDIEDARTYDSFGDLKTYDAYIKSSGAPLFSIDVVERDKLGRIVEKSESLLGAPARVFRYTYDGLGRLTVVEENGQVVRAYGYDNNGNRTSAAGVSGAIAYDAQDRLTVYDGVVRTYSASGDLASIGGDAVQVDVLGNLRSYAPQSGSTISYSVDYRNRRVAKSEGGVPVQRFLYEGPLRVVAELDDLGQVASRFVYGTRLNVPEYLVRSGATYRILIDERGSPRLVVDASSGAVVQSIDYEEFGKIIGETVVPGFSQPFGFAGGIQDRDTGFVRFGRRDYDPVAGRWISKDPFRFFAGETNLYVYAGNDPVNFTDKFGLVIDRACAERVRDQAVANMPPDAGDKYKHCVVSCEICAQCNTITGIAAGVYKEYEDARYGTGNPELGDLVADGYGVMCKFAEHGPFGPPEPGGDSDGDSDDDGNDPSCARCCQSSGYSP